MHKNKRNEKNKRTKNNKRTKKYSTGQPTRAKQQKGKTMKNNICKKGMTDEAYKYYKYTEFFKSNKKSIDMDTGTTTGKDNKKTVDKSLDKTLDKSVANDQ